MKRTISPAIFFIVLIIFSSGCTVDELCKNKKTYDEELFCGILKLDELINGGDTKSGGASGDGCEGLGLVKKNECLSKAALDSKDEKLCGQINEEMDRQRCYYALAVEKGDIKLCRISGYNMDDCYMRVAKKTGSGEPCDEIAGDYQKATCYKELALETGDGSFCKHYYGGDWNCYFSLAKTKGDNSICKGSATAQGIRSCYFNLASQKSDYSICDEAGTESDGCYDLFSSQWGDKTQCDRIKDPTLKEKCKNR